MGTFRTLVPVLVLTAAVFAACGEDDEPENEPPSSTTPSPPASESATATAGTSDAPTATDAAELPDACDVLTADDVATAFGVEFGDPTPGVGGHTEGDVEWQSDNCQWESTDLVEIQLALTGPADFTGDDAFTCPEPTTILSTVEPVQGLGEAAYWEVDDSPPLEAKLRVCAAAYNFDIDIEYEDGVDFQGDPQQQSIALAGVVLAELGG